jgi:hypothetical protein
VSLDRALSNAEFLAYLLVVAACLFWRKTCRSRAESSGRANDSLSFEAIFGGTEASASECRG